MGAVAACAACLLALQTPWASAADELSIAFPASSNPEIRRAQKTLVESWAYVDTLYVDATASDPDSSHEAWAKALQDALARSFKASSGTEVDGITRDLLATLGDPYTRLLQGQENEALTAEQEGKIVATGLGLQPLGAEGPAQQQQLLVVSFVVQDSPAAAAGVQEGDVLLSVAGEPVAGKELRQVYKLLGQEAEVSLARQPQLPAAAGDGDGDGDGSSSRSSNSSQEGLLQGAEVYTVSLKPQPLEFEPVQYGIIYLNKRAGDASSSGNGGSGSSSSEGISSSSGDGSRSSGDRTAERLGGRVGYLKLITFSATAPQQVAEALRDMQQQQGQQQGEAPLSGVVVDLRDNPGGIVEAGVDIAQDFLHAGQTLCIAADKGGVEEQVVLPEAHTLTELPLAVLVNQSTASTSELLAGALHDELHAPLIGSATYGKGRSQRVLPLSDGVNTLLVSTLRYFTPRHTVIDGAGLAPDVVCDPGQVAGQQWRGGRVGGPDGDQGSLLDDPCIRLAAERLVTKVAG